MVSNANVIISTFQGTLYDDGPLNLELIQTDTEFKLFLESIATSLPQYKSKGKGKPSIEWVDNDNDIFLKGKIVDFTKEILIVIRGAEIEQINFNNLNNKYEISFKNESKRDMNYFSAICKKMINVGELEYKNSKPFPIIEQRASLNRPFCGEIQQID